MSDAIAPFNPKFKVGDTAVFINDSGINYGKVTIVEVVHNRVRGATYHISPTDTPWFDHSGGDLFPPKSRRIRTKTMWYCNGNRPNRTLTINPFYRKSP